MVAGTFVPCAHILWVKGRNAKDINNEIFPFTVGSVCHLKRFITGSIYSLKDVLTGTFVPCVHILWAKGLNAKDINKEIFPVYGVKCSSLKAIHNWIDKFSQGRSKVTDDV
jgi:hypothetical protein